MAVAKRTGPDFLFLANAHSQKFNDLENGPPEANVSFINSSNQDWVSVTGECVTSDNSDPRIKEVWSKGTKAWFGDLGDGVHTGGPEDPRMKLIEIRAKREFGWFIGISDAMDDLLTYYRTDITYWKHEVGSLGFMKEITGANLLGGVAVTGTLREITGSELDEARKNDSSMSK
jgi:general stress protein 26